MFREQLKQKSTDELVQIALTASDQEDDLGWDAIWVLRERATLEVFEAAKTLCQWDDATKRIVGVTILSQLGFPKRLFLDETLGVFFHLMEQEQDARVLNSLGVGLGHISPEPRKVAALLRLKQHSDPQVRFGVAFGLSGEDDPLAIQALIDLSSDEDTSVRDWATFALGTQTDLDSPQIRQALFERATDPNDKSDAPGEGLVGLAKRHDLRAFDLTLRFLQLGDASVLVFAAAEIMADSRLSSILIELRGNPIYDGYKRSCLEAAIAACTQN